MVVLFGGTKFESRLLGLADGLVAIFLMGQSQDVLADLGL